MKPRVSERFYTSESRRWGNSDVVSDELDVDMANEFPGLKVGDLNVQTVP